MLGLTIISLIMEPYLEELKMPIVQSVLKLCEESNHTILAQKND